MVCLVLGMNHETELIQPGQKFGSISALKVISFSNL